jgi:hypothetical protein
MYMEDTKMAYGFAIDAGVPFTAARKRAEEVVHDIDWFVQELLALGVCRLQIEWNAQEHFNAVPAHLLERYVPKRKHLSHRDALMAVLQEGS